VTVNTLAKYFAPPSFIPAYASVLVLLDGVIDNDLILVWGKQKRITTGSDLLGCLLRGISIKEVKSN
jgi:hypothetical protein